MSASITDNACFSPLFADAEVAKIFSSDMLIDRMIDYEFALTSALKKAGDIDAKLGSSALTAIRTFKPDIAAIGQASLVDGLPVPEFVRQLKAHVGPDLTSAVHVGGTSQDLLDTALVLTLRDLSEELSKRITSIIDRLQALDKAQGSQPLMGRTRMQAALPITVSDRLMTWIEPLKRHLDRLTELRPRVEQLQFGGPVGLRDVSGGHGDEIASEIALFFELTCPDHAWHTMRDGVVEYAGWLSLVTGSLGKTGQDICLMAQQGIDEISFSGGGSSSAMPHKQNPILAETLVAFARFNAVQLSGMHHALVHEQERSGTAWTLEMMCLPLMAETTGKATAIAGQLIDQIERIGSP